MGEGNVLVLHLDHTAFANVVTPGGALPLARQVGRIELEPPPGPTDGLSAGAYDVNDAPVRRRVHDRRAALPVERVHVGVAVVSRFVRDRRARGVFLALFMHEGSQIPAERPQQRRRLHHRRQTLGRIPSNGLGRGRRRGRLCGDLRKRTGLAFADRFARLLCAARLLPPL